MFFVVFVILLAGETQVVDVDGKGAGRIFEGVGACSAGASSKLLMDYPERYRSEILDCLFKPRYGAGLQHLKVEIGSGTNSTDGTEPSHARTREELENPRPEYYQRGYEWWLMKEAKKRNQDIYLDCLAWGAPAWIGGGNYYSQDNADYFVAFIQGAKKYHNLTIDYAGVWNENDYDVEWIKLFRRTLDQHGLKDVQIGAADIVGGWRIVDDMLADKELFDAVDVVTVHYPYWGKFESTRQAKESGKRLWSGEDGPWRSDWEGASTLARMYNRNYITGRMTKTIIWAPITSFYSNLPYNDPGLMRANTPWSGHYSFPPAFWVTAHTGQFAAPGWQYLDSGCGYLEKGGSYVTLRKPGAKGDYSIIIETTDASAPQEVTFRIEDGLSQKKLSVWRTRKESYFVPSDDITPQDGSFTIHLEAGAVYSLTTTTGQQRPKPPPSDAPFPFPCQDDFESYPTGRLPKYFLDQGGVFEVAERSDGKGQCLRQMLTEESPMRHWLGPSPETIIGDIRWKDYEVSSDVYIEDAGYACVFGRLGTIADHKSPRNAYRCKVNHDGNWELSVAGDTLATGRAPFSANTWHNLKLKFSGRHIIAEINGDQVASVRDGRFQRGMAALGSGWHHARFDNFVVQAFTGPRPIADPDDGDSTPEAALPRGLASRERATRWEEALASGNGATGALVMGDPVAETIYLSHERLFLPSPYDSLQLPDMAEHLPQLRGILARGDYSGAARFWNDKVGEKGGPTKLLYTDPFHPAFQLLVSMEPGGEVRDYRRSINFETGEVTVGFSDDRGAFLRRLFVSRPDNVVVLSIRGPGSGKLDCELRLATLKPRHPINNPEYGFRSERERFGRSFRHVAITAENEWLTYRAAYTMNDGGYEGLARVISRGGSALSVGESISVKDADEVLVLVRIGPLEDAGLTHLEATRADLARLDTNYTTLLERHARIHGEIFRRVTLDLGGEKERGLTTEELTAKARSGDVPAALLEKCHDMGRYVFISSSGELPPNLQGVWTGTWSAPWSSDYTLDINLQLAITPALPGNMPEMLEGYFNFVEELIPDMRENAKMFYGCRGLLAPVRAVPKRGRALHRDVQWPLEFWTAGAAWLAQTFYDYYLFTGDREFLARRALPFLREAALFYEDFLTEVDANGKYIFSPSYSPENTPRNSDHQACVNATMDVAACKELLTHLIAACRELNVEENRIAKWEDMLSKMPEYMVNEDGALKEWTHPGLEDNYQHRHLSHLYPVWPGVEASVEKTPELFKACNRAAEMRMTEGLQNMASHSLGHVALASARLKNGELAFDALEKLAREFYPPNLLAFSWPFSPPFVAEVDLVFPAAVMEMLICSQPGFVELLPALPAQLTKGRIAGVLCRGRIAVESLEWDMEFRSVRVILRSAVAQPITLKLPSAITSIKVTQGSSGLEKSRQGPEYWRVTLPADESVTLAIAVE